MLTIDGSHGEGGGQVLRTALGLSMATGTPFRIEGIREHRRRPGLLAQHLTAVRAAAEISRARVRGDRLLARDLTFEPGPVRGGEYHFDVGTAGSACLVLQTVLPALLTLAEPTTLTLEGGTHNPVAPPFDFLARAFLPLVARMGAHVEAKLDRPGFYPAGGGRFTARVQPATRLTPLTLLDRGEIRRRRAVAMVARLPRHIGERELAVVKHSLGWPEQVLDVVDVREAAGPGNVLCLEVESEAITEVVTGFGVRGVRAERVAERAVDELRRYLESEVPVGRHLADQLLVPLALAGGGTFRTLPLSSHFTTNVDTIARFIPVEVVTYEEGDEGVRVKIGLTPSGGASTRRS